jgi:hypothetical protein
MNLHSVAVTENLKYLILAAEWYNPPGGVQPVQVPHVNALIGSYLFRF